MHFDSYSQDNFFTTLRFGQIELGMNIDSVNKYLDNPIELKKLKYFDDFRMDTFYVTYKNQPIRLIYTDYCDIETRKRIVTLNAIYCDDNQTRTKSGIKIGDDKFDIIKRLEASYLILNPTCDKGKEFSTVTLVDKLGRSMIFYFKLNMLIAIEIEDGNEDEC